MNYFFLLFFCIIFIFCISFFLFNGDILSPSIITSFMFLLAVYSIYINFNKWNVNLSIDTFLIVSIGLTVIVVVELFFKYLCQRNKDETNEDFFIPTIPLYKLKKIYLLCFLSLFLFTKSVFELANQIGVTGLLGIGAVKDSTQVNIRGIPLIAFDLCFYTGFVFIYLFLVNYIYGKKKFDYLIPVCVGIIAVVVRGARILLLQYITSGIFITIILISKKNNNKMKKISFKMLMKIIIIIILFLILFYNLREIVKGRKNDTIFIDYITYYVGSPLYLFDKVIEDSTDIYLGHKYFGACTFTNFYQTLYHLKVLKYNVSGLSFKTIVLKDRKLSGNEFTIFMRPYIDFGFLGMIIFIAAFYGFFSYIYYRKILYKPISTKNNLWLLYYSIFFYQIVMSFYLCFTCQDFRPQIIFFLIYIFLLYKYIYKLSDKEKKLDGEKNTK